MSGAERLLFVDDDIAFEPEHALHLLFDELPPDCVAAGGLYPVKGEPRLCAWGFEPPINLGRPGFVRTVHIGAGFLMVHRKAWFALQDLPSVFDSGLWYRPYFCPGVWDFNGQPTLLGEDYAFCEELRRRGLSIYLATLPRLGHVGEFAWYVEDSLRATGGRFGALPKHVYIGPAGDGLPPPPDGKGPQRRLTKGKANGP